MHGAIRVEDFAGLVQVERVGEEVGDRDDVVGVVPGRAGVGADDLATFASLDDGVTAAHFNIQDGLRDATGCVRLQFEVISRSGNHVVGVGANGEAATIGRCGGRGVEKGTVAVDLSAEGIVSEILPRAVAADDGSETSVRIIGVGVDAGGGTSAVGLGDEALAVGEMVNVHGLEQSADGGSRDGAGWPWRCAWHALVT